MQLPFNIFYLICDFSAVGITWEDAPEDQYAVINKDSKIRCVVKARPAATVDWLKESLILSTGKFQFSHLFIKPFTEYTVDILFWFVHKYVSYE